jgi:hypothetical protein
MLSEAFASALQSRRADYNAQFLAARRAAPELTEEAFKAFLQNCLDPLVSAVAVVDRGAVLEVVDTGYAVGLELLSQRLAGPRAHNPVLDYTFRQLFPALARFVAAAPDAVIPRLCNAVHHLSSAPGARVTDWSTTMAKLGPSTSSVAELLELGQVTAWLCGLAHYRASALELCQRLPAPLLAMLLCVQPESLSSVLNRLHVDPWFLPSAPTLGLRFAGTFGGFRGFGGPFLAPPRVARVGQGLFVLSGEDAWLVAADAFGCTLHRAQPGELSGARHDVEGAHVKVERAHVVVNGQALPLHDTGAPLSVAGNASTVLFTTAHSYAVSVVALEHSP